MAKDPGGFPEVATLLSGVNWLWLGLPRDAGNASRVVGSEGAQALH